MRVVETIEALRSEITTWQSEGKTIGFVPTMGFLHAGHLALMEKARMENDVLVTSVFVNPTQFGPGEDFEAYPREPQRDAALMTSVGVDLAFMPSAAELYPKGYVTYVEVEGEITQQLCGKSRPGHFKGVTTIVSKLFNLVQPDRAYFGMKDAQQLAVLQRMTADLNMPVTIVPCPIVREADGLALSSRNVYLSVEQRQEALALSQSLKKAQVAVQNGVRDPQLILDLIAERLSQAKGARVDYASVVDAGTLMPVDRLKSKILVALAVYFGKTRLIDNVILEVEDVCKPV